MRFLAKFSNAITIYYKTIYADDANEAMRQAMRWKRKGFVVASVVQQL